MNNVSDNTPVLLEHLMHHQQSSPPRFYKSSAAAAMVGGPKDFGGTKELVQLFGPPKAGRTHELGDQNAKANKQLGGQKN